MDRSPRRRPFVEPRWRTAHASSALGRARAGALPARFRNVVAQSRGHTTGSAGETKLVMSETVRVIVPIKDQNDILRARSAGRDVARSVGFGTVDQTRLATAISELARNALNYGQGGQCTIFTSSQADGRQTIRILRGGSRSRDRRRGAGSAAGLFQRRRARPGPACG